MSTPESTPSPETADEPRQLTPEEYAELLSKSAGHLVRIAKHKLVQDESLISPDVQWILDTPAQEMIEAIKQDEKNFEQFDDEDDFGFGALPQY